MALQQKIDEVNVITAPEIEMLIIHAEGAYDQFKRSGKAKRILQNKSSDAWCEVVWFCEAVFQ